MGQFAGVLSVVRRMEVKFRNPLKGMILSRATIRPQDADKLAKQLREFKASLTGDYSVAASDEPELHVVGVHVGQHPPGVQPQGNFNEVNLRSILRRVAWLGHQSPGHARPGAGAEVARGELQRCLF